jgi:hypothetical protein
MISRKEYHRQYYLDNRQRKLDATNKRREISRVFIWEYKSKHPCVRCGFSNPAALDFHHRNPNEKDIGIGDAVGNG